jgi:hypothetical protein
VVGHGVSYSAFKAENESSHFVTLKTPNGDLTVWSKGLEPALAKGEIKLSEQTPCKVVADSLGFQQFTRDVQTNTLLGQDSIRYSLFAFNLIVRKA